jgi:hypothetical protein
LNQKSPASEHLPSKSGVFSTVIKSGFHQNKKFG